MKVKKQTKRLLSLLLALLMVITTMLPVSAAPVSTYAATTASAEDGFQKIVHLDCGRKYFTKDWIKAFITEMAAAGFDQLQLAFGNDGLRFLLDDMSVTVNGTTYSSANVTAGVKAGNKAYYDSGVNELTQAEMDEIMAHASAEGIEIVPHMNMPGHMDAILDAIEYVGISNAHFTGRVTSVRSLNLSNDTAVAFTQALLAKYVDYFAAKGCNYFHIGADEFGNDAYNGSMGFPSMGSTLYKKFATFVNNAAATVKNAGMTPRAWNDGISYGSYTATFDTDIEITYWSSGWSGYNVASASKLSGKGHGMINTHGDYYYILGVNDIYTSGTKANHVGYDYTAASGFNRTTFMGSTVSNPVGGMFCVWCDYPGAETETEIAKYVRPILRVMSAAMDGHSNYEVDSIVPGGFNADGTINAVKHTYTSVVTAPTCTEKGYTTYTCTDCGDSYIDDEVAALGHSNETVTVDATCTTDGSVTTTCTICGESTMEVIPALGHAYSSAVTAPTCTEKGYTTYTCAACGDSYTANEVAAKGHKYSAVTKDATCTEDGSVTYTCSCGDTYSEVIEATGHDYKAVVIAPTCTEGGYTTYTCSTCGDTYTANEVEATGHDYKAVVTAPTCTEEGYTTYTCACGDTYVGNEVAALGHDYTAVVTAPTCTEGGYTTYTCHCGDSYIADEVAPLDHDRTSVVIAPTCTEEGYTIHTCTVCGTVTVDSYVDALGHDYETVTVDATCTKAGSVTETCTVCGDSHTEVIAALGHDYETETVVATCTEDGSVTKTCATCGDSSVEVIPATGHDYDAVVTAPTCTEGGYTTYTCACGDTYVADEVEATGHDYKAVVTAPTCTEGGYTTYTCACGHSYVGNETAATGHNYIAVEGENVITYTCEHCGDFYTESVGWVALPGGYVLDTDGIEIGPDHKYIIVGSNKNYALTLSGSTIGASAVTVSNNTINLSDASKYEFCFVDNGSKESGSYLITQDGSKGVYHMGGNMYYGTDNKGYWHIGAGSNGAYQLYDYDYSTWYLNYGYVWGSDSVSRFAVSSTARTVRLFKATEGYVRLSGELNQAWAHGGDVTESAVLDKLLIQTSTDGSTVSGTIAVTSDMLTWDKTFDGYTAGTYTATVSYNGEAIGTVTVTVTGEHAYNTVITSATCTQQGCTTHTCADCGLSYTDSYTAALGHSYNSVEGNGVITYTCTRCGDSYTESAVSYKTVSSLSSGNTYVITMYSGGKYYALSHSGNKLSAVQVTVSGGVVTSEVTDDLLWTYSSNKLSYKSGNTTYYLYAGSSSWWGGWWGSSATLSISTSSSSTVSFSSNRIKVGSYYLRYSGGSIGVNRSSSSTAYVFVETN